MLVPSLVHWHTISQCAKNSKVRGHGRWPNMSRALVNVFGIDWLCLDFDSNTNHTKKENTSDLYYIKFHTHWFVYRSWPDLIWHRDNVNSFEKKLKTLYLCICNSDRSSIFAVHWLKITLCRNMNKILDFSDLLNFRFSKLVRILIRQRPGTAIKLLCLIVNDTLPHVVYLAT